MKMIYKSSAVLLLAAAAFCSCSKKATPTPAPTPTVDISAVATNWVTNQWGGVVNDDLIFTIDKTTYKGTVDAISGEGYGFAAGTVMLTDIKPNSDGTYSCSGTYTPTGGGQATRSATLSLQNNNTQLTVFYPAINSSYPAITYIYQQTNYTVFAN